MKPYLVLIPAAAIVTICVGLLMRTKEPACLRLEAKIALARDFCEGLAERMANERCGALSDRPDVMGECKRVIVPAAASGCMDYLNIEHMKADLQSACG